MIENLKKTIEESKFSNIEGMELINEKLNRIFNKSESFINDVCKKIILNRGKRIRPMLVLSSGQSIGDLNVEMINAAIAIEIIHTASLVHDDIIDNSYRRRNNPTINYLFGNHMAVLCGDYLFAKSFEILGDIRLNKVLSICVNGIKEMCDGEINQAKDKFYWRVTEEEYIKRIYKKTGSLIAASCESGAICAGGEGKKSEALRNYGINIGYAFQIIDDLLDFNGEETIVGKPLCKDLLGGNITLPVILLLKQEKKNPRLMHISSNPNITKESSVYIKNEILNKGIYEKTLQKAELYIEKAKDSLKDIKNCNAKENLINIAEMVCKRKL
jgi:heptaprenyl diphosphate synthase